MRERINRLARGILSAGDPEIVLAPVRIDLPVRKGEVLRTEIAAESGNGIHLKGLVYSDSVRVRVIRPAFGGRKNRIADAPPGHERRGAGDPLLLPGDGRHGRRDAGTVQDN